jgi:hypothetical protein
MEDLGCLVRHPYAPSLDRIECSKGYTASNTRLVCVAVNFGMNEWGEDVYRELAKAAVEHGKVADLARSNHDWTQKQKAIIQEAQLRVANADGADKVHLTRVLAGHKATLKKGREGLSLAAKKANDNRKLKHCTTVLPSSAVVDTDADPTNSRLVRWVESDERLNHLGHGVQFLHDEVQRQPVAFLENFDWLQKNGGSPPTVVLPGSCPTSITAARWAEIIQNTREAVLVFLSDDANLNWSFRHGSVRIIANC